MRSEEKATNELRKNSFIYESLFPIYQSKVDATPSSHQTEEFRETCTECFLIDFRFNVQVAAVFRLPKSANFLPVDTKRYNIEIKSISNPVNLKRILNTKHMFKNSLHFRDISVQTYITTATLSDVDLKTDFKLNYDLSHGKSLTEKAIEDIIAKYFVNNEFIIQHKKLLTSLIETLHKLSQNSVVYLANHLIDSNIISQIESFVGLNESDLKLFDHVLLKLNSNKSQEIYFSLNKLLQLVHKERKSARFELNLERKKLTLDRFKKLVRFVIINREWLRNLEKHKRADRERFFLEYNKLEQSSQFLNSKKIQILFNKDEFKANTNLNTLITDIHRHILTKRQHERSAEQAALLFGLIDSIPRLNGLPKHIYPHVAQLLTLAIYEKGREIVREGHLAISFYYVINGSLDVLSIGQNGVLKIDELQEGDIFGQNSFKSRGISAHTIITNQHVEILTIAPGDIKSYMHQLELNEKIELKVFLKHWWPTNLWNWDEENFEHFLKHAEILRFSHGDLIFDGLSTDIDDHIYLVYKGNVALQQEFEQKKLKKKSIFKVCDLEKFSFLCPTRREASVLCMAGHGTEIISINKKHFAAIHRHAKFMLAQLIDNWNMAMSGNEQFHKSYFKNI